MRIFRHCWQVVFLQGIFFLTVQTTTTFKAVTCSAHQKPDCACCTFRLCVCLQTSFSLLTPNTHGSSPQQHRRTESAQRPQQCPGLEDCGLPNSSVTKTWWVYDWHLWGSRVCAFYKWRQDAHLWRVLCFLWTLSLSSLMETEALSYAFSGVPNKPILEHLIVVQL